MADQTRDTKSDQGGEGTRMQKRLAMGESVEGVGSADKPASGGAQPSGGNKSRG